MEVGCWALGYFQEPIPHRLDEYPWIFVGVSTWVFLSVTSYDASVFLLFVVGL